MDLVAKVKNGTWPDGMDWDLKPLSLCHKYQSVVVVLDEQNEKQISHLNTIHVINKA